MALKLAGEEIGIQEKIETIVYCPGLQDTGDLETVTKTITATSEASGVGNADYSKALTLPKSDDARLVVKRIAARLEVTRDSGTSNNLYCRVYVDVQDAAHRLFDVDAQANSLSVTDLTSGTIFDLLKDGAAHTFYFFFWVDSGDSVISLVQLWEAVGGPSITQYGQEILSLTHSGYVQISGYFSRIGTGSVNWMFTVFDTMVAGSRLDTGSAAEVTSNDHLVLIPATLHVNIKGTVATDINYANSLYLVLRSQQ